jgi:hypothetical protein
MSLIQNEHGGDPVESRELLWVADGVDASDAPVPDGEAHGSVDLPADVEPGWRVTR